MRTLSALVLAFSIAACGTKQAPKAPSPINEEPATETKAADDAEKTNTVGPATGTQGDPCDGGEVSPKH